MCNLPYTGHTIKWQSQKNIIIKKFEIHWSVSDEKAQKKKPEQIKISKCKLKDSSVKVELHSWHEMNSTEEWWWLLQIGEIKGKKRQIT